MLKLIQLIVLICLSSCAYLKAPATLVSEAKVVTITRTKPQSCTWLAPIEEVDTSTNAIKGAVNSAKNSTFQAGGNLLWVEKLYSKGDGTWGYIEGQAYQCATKVSEN